MVFFQNGSTINGVKTQPSVAYGFEQSQNIFNRAFGPLKLSGYTLAPSGSSTGSLIVASGTAYAPGSNYTVNPNEPSYTVDNGTNISKIFRYRQSGSNWVYDTNGGAGYTTINPGQYSNNGVLTTVQPNDWSIQRVFWFPNSVVKAIVVYYGNASYATEAEAAANIPYEPFVEAPNTSANAIYLGAIVINGSGTFTSAASFKILPGGLFRQVGGSGGGGSVITQTLSGLSDVAISGPTNLQPFAYSTTAGKWINTSILSASIVGNATSATSASYAATSSWAIDAINATTASYVTLAQTASYVLNAVSASYAQTASVALSASYVPSLQQVVNNGNGIANFGGNGTASIQSTNFTSNRTLYLNDDNYPTIRIVDNLNASNNLQIDIDTLSLDGVSYNWSDIVSSTSSFAISASYALTASYLNGSTINVNEIFPTTGNSANRIFTENSNLGFGGIGDTVIYTSISDINLYAGAGTRAVKVTGSLDVSNGITGSLFGTASYALTSSYLNPVTNGYIILTQVSQSLNYADDTEAAAGGVPLGGLYRNGNFIAIRIV